MPKETQEDFHEVPLENPVIVPIPHVGGPDVPAVNPNHIPEPGDEGETIIEEKDLKARPDAEKRLLHLVKEEKIKRHHKA